MKQKLVIAALAVMAAIMPKGLCAQEIELWAGEVEVSYTDYWRVGDGTHGADNPNMFADAGLQTGDVIRLYMTANNDPWSLLFYDGHWHQQESIATAIGISSPYSDYKHGVFSETWDLSRHNGCLEFMVTDTLREQLTTLTDWGFCWVIQGQGVIITKITLAHASDAEPYAALTGDTISGMTLTFYYDDKKEQRSGMSVGPFSSDTDLSWYNKRTNITTAVFDTSFSWSHTLTSTAFWFTNCSKLTEIQGLQYLNTENVTDMRSMFSGCSSLKSLDVSGFNMGNVTDIRRMFSGCTRLAAIQAGSANLPDSVYAQITNPNLLVYVTDAAHAPAYINNVVVNGVAQNITLTDGTENCDFYAPQAFTAERISYTRDFRQKTQVGVSRGWESLALPFNVQTITHETRGVISPFGSNDSNKHFWLRRLMPDGLQSVTAIEANTPYVIAMPNSEEYSNANNLYGRVTFSATHATVPATQPVVLALADSSIVMQPALQRIANSSVVWALNVGEERGQYLEGSVFERDYREVRPFEAYTVHRSDNAESGHAPRYVPVGNLQDAATDIETVSGSAPSDRNWYTIDGRRLQGCPAQKGLYIMGGRKVIVK